jgi:hypothetical protein
MYEDLQKNKISSRSFVKMYGRSHLGTGSALKLSFQGRNLKLPERNVGHPAFDYPVMAKKGFY